MLKRREEKRGDGWMDESTGQFNKQRRNKIDFLMQ